MAVSAGIAGPQMRTHARPREFLARVPGKSGDVGEAHQGDLLAALEFGNLATDEEGGKLKVEHSGSHGASHGLVLLTTLVKGASFYIEFVEKLSQLQLLPESALVQQLSKCI
jgi:hypothetical protein